MKKTSKGEKAITLIALVVTIVIILILAGVTINMLLGENGIIKQATNAKEKTELPGLKEQVELEVLALNMNQNDFTSSEVIDKLVESGILESDRKTFTNNSNYTLSTNGDILHNGNTIETVELTKNITSLEVNVSPSISSIVTGTRIITCKDGTVQYSHPDTDDKARFTIIANTPPSGKKFAYWIDKYNNIVSYYSTQLLLTIDDNTYTAIYVDEQEYITKTPCINIYSNNQTKDGYLQFQSFFVSNSSTYIPTHVGTLATKNINLANKTDLIVETTNSEIYYRGSDISKTINYAYNWTKSNVGSDTWYCRGYATLTYEDGSTETIYTAQ